VRGASTDNRKIKGFKDVLQSLLGFVKQIMAQIAAQLVTQQIIKFAPADSSLAERPNTDLYNRPGCLGLRQHSRKEPTT
jgi:hypothetical protein